MTSLTKAISPSLPCCQKDESITLISKKIASIYHYVWTRLLNIILEVNPYTSFGVCVCMNV